MHTRAQDSSEEASLVLLATAQAISGLVRRDTQSNTPTKRNIGVCSTGFCPACRGGCLTRAFCACAGSCCLCENDSGPLEVRRSLSDLCSSDLCLVVLLAAGCDGHGAQPCFLLPGQCAKIQSEHYWGHVCPKSAWNKRAPSISAPELLGSKTAGRRT